MYERHHVTLLLRSGEGSVEAVQEVFNRIASTMEATDGRVAARTGLAVGDAVRVKSRGFFNMGTVQKVGGVQIGTLQQLCTEL